MGARRRHKLLKQALRKRIIGHALRMPLNPHNPVGIASPFHGLDRAIRRVRCDAEFFSRLVNGLVVAAVDMRDGRLGKLRENASGAQNRVMLLVTALCSRREIGSSMWNGERAIGPHIWYVLNQRAFLVHV